MLYFILYITAHGKRELAPAFLFPGVHLGACKPKTTKIAPFRINHLRNPIFVSPFLCYSYKVIMYLTQIKFSATLSVWKQHHHRRPCSCTWESLCLFFLLSLLCSSCGEIASHETNRRNP